MNASPDYFDDEPPEYDPPDVTCTKCGESVDAFGMWSHWCGTEEKPEDD